MITAKNILESIGAVVNSSFPTAMGFSLPRVNPKTRQPPLKSAWSEGDRLIQMLGAASSQDYKTVRPYINIIGAAEAGFYEYNQTTTPDDYEKMVQKAKSTGIESLNFPKEWKSVFPDYEPSQPK
jgi:hypothetical protein